MTTNTTTEVFQAAWDAPMSHRGHMSLRYDGSIVFSGLDTGELTLIDHKEVPGVGTILVVHEKGSSHWTGRGMAQSYSGAEVHTILVERKDTYGYRYVTLASVPAKSSEAERDARHERVVTALRNAEAPHPAPFANIVLTPVTE